MRTVVIAFVICAVVSSCHDSGTVPEGGLTGRTDKFAYIANEGITFVVSNNGSDAAYLSSCCSGLAFYVDRFENGSWRQFEGHGIPCLAMCPIGVVFLPTEQQYIDSLSLQQRGVYRLRISFRSPIGNGMDKELTTNQFIVQ